MTAPPATRLPVTASDIGSLSWDTDGLIPVVVQDAVGRRVLMLAYMNREALELTLETGRVHFWSRSREELWLKGETSGNYLSLVEVRRDCDSDTLLVRAVPHGPACHEGTDTCFDDGPLGEGLADLEELWSTIMARSVSRPPGSYTTKLLEEGPDLPARKLAEEALEVVMAAKDHAVGQADDRRLAEEAADLIYHLLVVLAERGVRPNLVLDVLRERRR